MQMLHNPEGQPESCLSVTPATSNVAAGHRIHLIASACTMCHGEDEHSGTVKDTQQNVYFGFSTCEEQVPIERTLHNAYTNSTNQNSRPHSACTHTHR